MTVKTFKLKRQTLIFLDDLTFLKHDVLKGFKSNKPLLIIIQPYLNTECTVFCKTR
jgi:hypothetical protein